MEESTGLRRAIMLVSVDLLVGMATTKPGLCGRIGKVVKGLPDGCRIVATAFMPDYMAFGICVEHESFDAVPERHKLPIIPGPTWESV